MATKRYTQGPWPPRTDDQPDGWFLNPDGYFKYDRSLSGPLRLGTAPGVGPRGAAVWADNTRRSDMGMDRISPRDFDPAGTCRNRFGDIGSDLIARQIRGRNRVD